MSKKSSASFLQVGKSIDSNSVSAGGFKRYIGLADSYVLDVNPSKDKLDELMGYESKFDVVYTGSDETGPYCRAVFIVRTDPESTVGVEITERLTFTVRNTPAYNRDKTKVQIMDDYGQSRYVEVDEAKNDLQKYPGYRIARVGEFELSQFLRTYLCVPDARTYDGATKTWSLKSDPSGSVFRLEHIPDYVKGNVFELKEAIALQPHNKVKLLYGIRTNDEGKQYTAIPTRDGFILRANASAKSISYLDTQIKRAKDAGAYSNVEFSTEPLHEYKVEPTDFGNAQNAANDDPFGMSDDKMPWD